MKFRTMFANARSAMMIEIDDDTKQGKSLTYPPDGYVAKLLQKGLPKSETISQAKARLEELRGANVRLQADVMLNRISPEDAEKKMNEILHELIGLMALLKDFDPMLSDVEEDPILDSLLARGMAVALKAMASADNIEVLDACDKEIEQLEKELDAHMVLKQLGLDERPSFMDLVRLKMPSFSM